MTTAIEAERADWRIINEKDQIPCKG